MPDYNKRRTMMVDTQVRPSDVTKFPIIDAMLSIPREIFVPDTSRETAYRDGPIDLGDSRSMLEPRTLAKMLDALDISLNDLVLDLGCGYGYSSAVIARMAEAVVAVEENEMLASDAETQLGSIGADNVAVVTGAIAEGAAKHGPYDAIVLQGAVERLPETLEDQLKEGGRIASIFMDGAMGTCRIGHKIDGRLSWRFAFNATAPILPGCQGAPSFQF